MRRAQNQVSIKALKTTTISLDLGMQVPRGRPPPPKSAVAETISFTLQTAQANSSGWANENAQLDHTRPNMVGTWDAPEIVEIVAGAAKAMQTAGGGTAVIIRKSPDSPKEAAKPSKETGTANADPSSSGRNEKLPGDVPQTPSQQMHSAFLLSNNIRNNCNITNDKLRRLKEQVDRAVHEHKTFCVIGAYPSVRHAMRRRGWVEKHEIARIARLVTGPYANATFGINSNEAEETIYTDRQFQARLMKNVAVDFLWTVRCDNVSWKEIGKKQLVNRFPKAYFTTKWGLCTYLQQMHWYSEDSVAETRFPRCYNICQEEDFTAFVQDFRMTACQSLVRWFIEAWEKNGVKSVSSAEGKVPLNALDFALNRCNEQIRSRSHHDIDEDPPVIWTHQWDQFLVWYYMIVHENCLFTEAKNTCIRKKYWACKSATVGLRKCLPEFDLDGVLNIWIVKPGARSRGRGIELMNKIDVIVNRLSPSIMKESRYVVQKYIERPLLVYDTKFDIRQWFLVTSAFPLTVWMYKDSYLRFCSQRFNLRNLHESVHLSNNAVQCRYKNGQRNNALPSENMWDCHMFQSYLRSIGEARRWEESIYPGMKAGIVGALLASQEHMDQRPNCFELYGADFMLGEDFSPWLIEINACPCMAPSTSITSRLCPQCLEDVIKVVIDRRENIRADTGRFELAYRQVISPTPSYLGMSLQIRGQKLSRFGNLANRTSPMPSSHRLIKRATNDTPDEKAQLTSPNQTKVDAKTLKQSRFTKPKVSVNYIGPIIVDLIEDLARQLDASGQICKDNEESIFHLPESIKWPKESRSKIVQTPNKTFPTNNLRALKESVLSMNSILNNNNNNNNNNSRLKLSSPKASPKLPRQISPSLVTSKGKYKKKRLKTNDSIMKNRTKGLSSIGKKISTHDASELKKIHEEKKPNRSRFRKSPLEVSSPINQWRDVSKHVINDWQHSLKRTKRNCKQR